MKPADTQTLCKEHTETYFTLYLSSALSCIICRMNATSPPFTTTSLKDPVLPLRGSVRELDRDLLLESASLSLLKNGGLHIVKSYTSSLSKAPLRIVPASTCFTVMFV